MRRTTGLLQFDRLRDAMLQVLREERVLRRRYSHVVRMRTDLIWLETWPSHSDLSTLIPPDSATLAGDFLDQGIFSDYFWIASRAIAWAVYVDTWYDINLPMHRSLVEPDFGRRLPRGWRPVSWRG